MRTTSCSRRRIYQRASAWRSAPTLSYAQNFEDVTFAARCSTSSAARMSGIIAACILHRMALLAASKARQYVNNMRRKKTREVDKCHASWGSIIW